MTHLRFTEQIYMFCSNYLDRPRNFNALIYTKLNDTRKERIKREYSMNELQKKKKCDLIKSNIS